MVELIVNFIDEIREKIIDFTVELVKIKSYTGEEENVARAVYNKMQSLGYDSVEIDCMGNVIGIIGDGQDSIMFDGHLDTVMVDDCSQWSRAPFDGIIEGDTLYGRGSVDMKGAVAAMVYCGYAIKKLGLLKEKSIIISASVMEEDYDGEALKYIIENTAKNIECVIIGEPTQLLIATGHRGRALLKMEAYGVSSHGSAPEKGENAIYKVSTIIDEIKNLNYRLTKEETGGSVALTKIESTSPSLNAIPSMCTLYLDRRLGLNENLDTIKNEMSAIVKKTDIIWEILV